MGIYAEILDFGYPQNTDPGVLKTFITQQGVRTAAVSICQKIVHNKPLSEQGGAGANYLTGDWSDRLASGGHQVPPE